MEINTWLSDEIQAKKNRNLTKKKTNLIVFLKKLPERYDEGGVDDDDIQETFDAIMAACKKKSDGFSLLATKSK